MTDAMRDEGLFEIEAEPTAFLRDRFGEPPFTVLDRRGGSWLARDRKWKALGIESEIGRGEDLAYKITASYMPKFKSGTSIFSPTLAELMVRWYSKDGSAILDPFAGGSVRGIVSSLLGRDYTGIELRTEQVEANEGQTYLADQHHLPTWHAGDSTHVQALVGPGYGADMIMSCPPYAYLEQYSDDPRDLSSMTYPDFLDAYRHIIQQSTALLRPDRFAVWVVGEVREKGGDGSLLGLVPDTIQAFRDAGLEPYNDHIIITPVGTTALRAPRQFDVGRKAGRTHEYCLVFVKGNARAATDWLGPAGTVVAYAPSAEEALAAGDGAAEELL